MRKLLSEKEKDEYDSGDELEHFAHSIAATTYPPGFRMPHLSKFNGDGDPSDHLGMFNNPDDGPQHRSRAEVFNISFHLDWAGQTVVQTE